MKKSDFKTSFISESRIPRRPVVGDEAVTKDDRTRARKPRASALGEDVISISTLFVLLLIVFREPIMDKGVIMQSDSPYFWPLATIRSIFTWNTSFLGVSQVQTMFGGGALIAPLTALLNKIFPHHLVSQILNIGPLFLFSLVVFYVSKKVSGSSLFALFLGIFSIFNNFTFQHLVYWPGAFFYGPTALTLLLYQGYRIYISNRVKFANIIQISLLSFFCSIHPFFLLLYFSFLSVFAGFYLVKGFSWKTLGKFSLILILALLFNFYWLAPFLYGLGVTTASDLYKGNLMPVYSGFKGSATYLNLLRFLHYPGNLSLQTDKFMGNLYYFVILSAIPLSLLFRKRLSRKAGHLLVFFVVSFLIFFTLSLGPNSVLTGYAWSWAFANVPVFGFLRTFTRFSLLSLLTLFFILALVFRSFNPKYKKIGAVFLILFLLGISTPFFSGDLGGTLVSVHVPEEYFMINKKYFHDSSADTGIISYPNTLYESYTWSVDQRGKGSVYFKCYFFSKPIAYNSAAVLLDRRSGLLSRVFSRGSSFNFYEGYDEEIDLLNIEYVLIEKNLVDIFRSAEKVPYDRYRDYFLQNGGYSLLEDNGHFSLFRNDSIDTGGYFPRFYIPEYSFNLSSPGQIPLPALPPEVPFYRSAFFLAEGGEGAEYLGGDFTYPGYEVNIPVEGDYEVLVGGEDVGLLETGRLTIGGEELKPEWLLDGDWLGFGKVRFEEGSQVLEFVAPEARNVVDENLVDEGAFVREGQILYAPLLKWEPDKEYQLSLDYRLKEGVELAVGVAEREVSGETYSAQRVGEIMGATGDGVGWWHFEGRVRASSNAKEALIYMESDIGGVLESAEFKNIAVKREREMKLILRKLRNLETAEINGIPEITFVKVNPTKYKVKVVGALDPYTLIFSESFHKGWKLYKKDEGDPIEADHLLVNGYANSWYIEPKDVGGAEDYELIVEFWPQRLFYIGLFISGLTLVGCLGFLGYDFVRRERR